MGIDPERPRRSEKTKEAILLAARTRFGAEGYERTTIRAIAKDARIDPSMVMRYFGNKEALFALASELDLRLPSPHEIPEGQLGKTLVLHFLNRWADDDALAAMLRAAATNEAGAQRLRDTLAEQLVPFVTAVCPVPQQAPRRAALLASQMLGVALCRFVLAMPPAVAMSTEELAAWIGPTVVRYLTAEAPESG